MGAGFQAGLLLTELIARRIAHRILIVSPSGPLLDQWAMEMSHRFGLRFQIINRQALDEVRRSTELGAIPFDHISLDLPATICSRWRCDMRRKPSLRCSRNAATTLMSARRSAIRK